jgi:hypothetical protein
MLSLANGISAKAVNSISGHLSAALPTVMLHVKGAGCILCADPNFLLGFKMISVHQVIGT